MKLTKTGKVMPMTEADLDREIVQSAKREAAAQLKIIEALEPLSREARERVVSAVAHLLEAESRVPGVLDALAGKNRASRRRA